MGRFDRFAAPVRTAWRNAAAGWDQFWFTPANATALGWLRILSGGMVVYTHAVWGLRLDAFFGLHGWQDPLAVQVLLQDSAATSFWWCVPPDWAAAVHAGCQTVLALYVLGAALRVTAPLALVIVISYANRAPQANFGLDQINTLLTAYVCLGSLFLPRRDACLSLDHLWHRFRSAWKLTRRGDAQPAIEAPHPHAAVNVAARLIQIHMAIVYLHAGLGKMKGDAWWDGTAVWMAAANYEYQSGDLTWMAWCPYIPQFATMMTVAWEVTFFLLVWRPRWQPWVLLCGVMMHLGIGGFLGMWTFGTVMIVTYVAFIPPEALLRIQGWCDARWRGDHRTMIAFNPASRWSCLRAAWIAAWTPDHAWAWRVDGEAPMPAAAGRAQRAVADPIGEIREWWQNLGTGGAGGWPFSSGVWDRTRPLSVLLIDARLKHATELQEYLLSKGYDCSVVATPLLGACQLAVSPYQTIVLVAHGLAQMPEIERLRNLCLRHSDQGPTTLLALERSCLEHFLGQATPRHRIIAVPYTLREIRTELAAAWNQQAPLDSGILSEKATAPAPAGAAPSAATAILLKQE